MAKAIYTRAPDEGLMHPVEVSNARLLSKQIAAPNRPMQPVANRRASTVAIAVGGGPSPAVSGIQISVSNPVAESAGVSAAPGGTGLAADAGHVHALAAGNGGSPPNIANAGADGSSSNVARADHTHELAVDGVLIEWLGGILTGISQGNGSLPWVPPGTQGTDNGYSVPDTGVQPGTTTINLTSGTAVQIQSILSKGNASANTGIGMGWTSAAFGSGYLMIYDAGFPTLYKMVAGVRSVLATYTESMNDTLPHKMRFVLLPIASSGNYMSLYLDDVLLVSNFFDASLNMLAQPITFGVYNDTAPALMYDNWYRIGAL